MFNAVEIVGLLRHRLQYLYFCRRSLGNSADIDKYPPRLSCHRYCSPGCQDARRTGQNEQRRYARSQNTTGSAGVTSPPLKAFFNADRKPLFLSFVAMIHRKRFPISWQLIQCVISSVIFRCFHHMLMFFHMRKCFSKNATTKQGSYVYKHFCCVLYLLCYYSYRP